jgi:sec-independent protein translocase protein TatA
MPSLGPMELVIILIIALLVVGPKKLPNVGHSLGSGMREFKEAITTGGSEPKTEDEKA